MKKTFYFIFTAAVLLLTACNGGAKKADAAKHTDAYIRERVETIYGRYLTKVVDENGMRVFTDKTDLTDTYCSAGFKSLLARAQDAAGEDYIVLDCDPWTQSQDDVEFVCSVKSVDAITDSTATVTLATENFGYAGQLDLQLVYESGDWFVDDFGGNLREYLQSFIDGE